MTSKQKFLEENYSRYHKVEFLFSDPLEFVLKYSDPKDQEIVGIFSALFAYGNVKQIRNSIGIWLERIKEFKSPSEWMRAQDSERNQIWKGFVHRFNPERDWILISELIHRSVMSYGSIAEHVADIAHQKKLSLTGALDELISEWKTKLGAKKLTPSMKHLLSHPSSGGTCKRWMMFLRWMVREDALDPGTWQKLLKSSTHQFGTHELVMPLDTHTGRWSRKLRLTRRKTLNWKTALEVTKSLKSIDPIDPIRYDFSLCRVGMFQK
ncbi:MAG: TIGR02757 family protein [Xanthomonadaceae bacterium]|nr:TIGR02757 family protein [Xanthomonadaceae bacterium]